MNDDEIDKLDGLDLRRAVCEAVGWEWDGPLGWGRQKMPDGTMRYRSCLDWDDAIAACEASGMSSASISWSIGGCAVGHHPGMRRNESDGATPKSLFRALLKAIGAKRGTNDR